MINAIDAADEDNNDDDDSGHNGSEDDDGRNAGREADWFTVPLNAQDVHFVPTRMKMTTTTAVGDKDDISAGGPSISGNATIYLKARLTSAYKGVES